MKDEISVESANNCVDSLISEIHRLQEPKTPTKEQIDIIVPKVKEQFIRTKNIWLATKIAITEWEKIRNQQ